MMALPVSGSRPTVYRPSQRPSLRFRMFPSPFARRFCMVSAPFATNNTVTKGIKLLKRGIVIRKLSFAPQNLAALSLTIAAQFLRCRRRSSLVTAVRFLNGQEVLSLTTAAQNMHVFLRKSPLCRSHFFEWLKTVISSNACGTSTLKSPLLRAFFTPHVHQRLRKRPPRCTLDCGFKTPESPALRGFVGGLRALATAALYLVLKSNGLHRPKIRLKKFSFSLKIVPAYISKKLPSQCWPKPLFIAFFSLSHKRPTFAFTGESGYTLGFRRRIAHSGLHAETGGVSDGGGITTLGAFHTFRKPCVARCQNGKLCRFWGLVGGAPKERRDPSGQRCAYARRCSEASRPRWAA